MKKIIGKILGIIFVLILGYQQFSYADVVSTEELYFEPLAFLLGFIGVIILIISAISFLCLKVTVKKQTMQEYNNENSKTLSTQKIEKKKNRIERRLYIWSMILSIIILMYLDLKNEISGIRFFVPIILFIISFIIRLFKKRKISNIICVISIGLVLGNIVLNIHIKNYNNQFIKYETRNEALPIISDIDGLINTAIKNNRIGRKVTIVYQNKNYTSVNELQQLLSKINKNKKYISSFEYDKNYEYIENIDLCSSGNLLLWDCVKDVKDGKLEGEYLKYITLNNIISAIKVSITNNEDIELTITYISGTNKTTINASADNLQEIINLKSRIKYGVTYDIEIKYPFIDNIIITEQ